MIWASSYWFKNGIFYTIQLHYDWKVNQL